MSQPGVTPDNWETEKTHRLGTLAKRKRRQKEVFANAK